MGWKGVTGAYRHLSEDVSCGHLTSAIKTPLERVLGSKGTYVGAMR